MDEVVRVANLTKVYSMGDQRVEALKDISLTIESGDFAAIMGASGSGKSTCMNIIGCLDTPTSGDYWLGGERVGGLSKDPWRKSATKSSVSFSRGSIFWPRTSARENVQLPLIYGRVPAA